jgi:putative ATPase
MILWGPPGVGKTTLARLMAEAFHAEFIALSAVLSGVKDIRDAVIQAENAQAQKSRATILFVDEVHRFNKAQQDAFLPHVESGLFTFIGATTENPSFEVIGALLSRSTVYVLQPLSADELAQLLDRALAAALPGRVLSEDVRQILVAYADGDGRRLINLVEQLGGALEEAARQKKPVEPDVAFVESALARSLRQFDKGGEAFYDQISALHKAVRGSHPDAALYWFCRMLDGGADPRYLARRIVRMAWEDIGLADPRAAQIVNNAAETYERLGSPEGELALAQAVLYLSVAPKSNAGYLAYSAARAFIREDRSRPVPMHLRNAPTRLMKELGYGHDYRYAHDEDDGYAAGETYLPDDMAEPYWYRPTPRGLEAKIGEKLAEFRRRDKEATTKRRTAGDKK